MAQFTGTSTQILARDPPESWYSEIPLSRPAARYLWWGLAVKTRSLYDTGRRSYVTYCRISMNATPFPATIQTLSSWIAMLGEHKIQPKTIKAYLAGVRSSQIDTGFEDLETFHHPVLNRIIAGIKRKNGEADKKERMPITKNILLRLVKRLDLADNAQATLHAAYCLAFAGFLRAGEFTYTIRDLTDPSFESWHLTRKSVHLEADKLFLSLPASKTDPFRRGITLTIAASGDEACAVKSLRNLITRFPLPATSPLFYKQKAFTREYLTTAMRSGLKSLGITGNYSDHSFRRGAATSAKEAGLSENDIQLLGRWKSDSYKLYIQTHQSHILATSRRFQHPPSAS